MDSLPTRRQFLRMTGIAATGFLFPANPIVAGISSLRLDPAFSPDVDIVLQASPREVSLLPGASTRVWSYRGKLLKGFPGTLEHLSGSYVGPIIRVRKGQRVRIRFANDLSQRSIIHWHGLHVSPEMDAHPRFAVVPGKTYVYEFEVSDRAGTYWFHPHPDMITGQQVYHGLAGLFLVSDEEEQALGLPSNEYDIPLVIQDRMFGSSNQLLYSMSGGPMGTSDGFLGNDILVNGRMNFRLSVATKAYRFRLLNGSNSRIYKLAWENGMPLTVIATDGGLLEKPVQRRYVMLSPGERIELFANFRNVPVGSSLRFVSQPFEGFEFGQMPGNSMAMPNGTFFPVFQVDVVKRKQETYSLPETLSSFKRYDRKDAVNANQPRRFRISSSRMGQWLINGAAFEMDQVAENEVVRLNTLEAWEFINEVSMGGMGGRSMVHPIHIHGLQFQIIQRKVLPAFSSGWRSVSHGFVDRSWKDTFMIMPGERVTVLLKFRDFSGMYVYHCHNLEHEDRGMMRNYLILR